MAMRRARCTPMRRQCSSASLRERWLQASAVFGFYPANTVDDDDVLVYADEKRRTSSCACVICGSNAASQPARRSTAWPISSRRSESGLADYVGAFAVTAGIGIEQHIARFEAAARRLQRHHSQGAGRPAGRGLRRVPARARAARVLGLCADREPVEQRPDSRELSRHPAGTRLPGLPGSHREGQALGTCSTSRRASASR